MQEIQSSFEGVQGHGFPGIIGVIDGTHIEIRPPSRQRSAFINRKKFPSLNTQVVFYIYYVRKACYMTPFLIGNVF